MFVKLLLLVFGLQLVSVSSNLSDANLAKKLNRERKEKLVTERERQAPNNLPPRKLKDCITMTLNLAGPYCQSLVAYVVGTFQTKDAKTPSFSAQFQVRLDADLRTKRITVDADEWNEKIASSDDFELDFYYAGSYQW
jgi:hypothetical protein